MRGREEQIASSWKENVHSKNSSSAASGVERRRSKSAARHEGDNATERRKSRSIIQAEGHSITGLLATPIKLGGDVGVRAAHVAKGEAKVKGGNGGMDGVGEKRRLESISTVVIERTFESISSAVVQDIEKLEVVSVAGIHTSCHQDWGNRSESAKASGSSQPMGLQAQVLTT